MDTSLMAEKMTRVLGKVAAWRVYLRRIWIDNGPEFVSVKMARWAKKHAIRLDFIEPGKPVQNAYEEIFDFYLFSNLSKVRAITEE